MTGRHDHNPDRHDDGGERGDPNRDPNPDSTQKDSPLLVELLITPKPVLHDTDGTPVEIPEGDWSEFLSKTLTLSDGTEIAYRDFDRLGPDFWKHYPQDWVQVSAQLYDDLTFEANQKRTAVWKVAENGNPLRRYNVFIHQRKDGSRLGKISNLIYEAGGGGLQFDPSIRMGIRVEGALPHSINYLPLSWLGMDSSHVPLYLQEIRRAQKLTDHKVLAGAYLGGATGRALLPDKNGVPGLVVSFGEFQNDWAGRHFRRGTRAFRVLRSEMDSVEEHDSEYEAPNRFHFIKNAEFTMAEDLKSRVIALTLNPSNSEKHEAVAQALSDYLLHTGIRSSIKKAEDGITFDIEIILETTESWEKGQEKFTTWFDGVEVEGSSKPPILPLVAETLKDHGYRVVFNSLAFMLNHSTVDVQRRRVVLRTESLFLESPEERIFLDQEECIETILPNEGSTILGIRETIITEGDFGVEQEIGILQPTSTVERDLILAQQLEEEISEIKAARIFLDPNQYQGLLRPKVAEQEKLVERADKGVRLLHSLLGSEIHPEMIKILESSEGVYTVEVSGIQDEPVRLMLYIDDPMTEPKAEAIRLLANERETLALCRRPLQKLLERLPFNKELIELDNVLTNNAISQIQEEDQRRLEIKIESLETIPPAAYFHTLENDRHYWQDTPDDARKGFFNRVIEELRNDTVALREFIEETKDNFLGTTSGHDFYDGVDNWVAESWFRILKGVAKQASESEQRDILRDLAKHLAQNAKNSWTVMNSFGLLRDTNSKDDETRQILLAGLNWQIPGEEEDPTGPINWAIGAIGELFPEDAKREFPRIISEGSPNTRTSAFRVLTDNEIYSEETLLAAARGFDLETRGSPGADGYIRSSKTKNPEVVAILKEKLREKVSEGEGLYSLNQVFQSLDILDDEIQELLEQHLRKSPAVQDGSAEVLYKIDNNHPLAIRSLRDRLVAEEEPHHPWNYLEALEKYARVHPQDEVTRGAVAKLEALELQRFGGFDHDLFAEIKRNSK